MRPAIVIADSPACRAGQLRDRLRGPWRQGLQGVMVLLPLRGLAPAEIVAVHVPGWFR